MSEFAIIKNGVPTDYDLWRDILDEEDLPIHVLGGPSSGNFGHAGRPGKVGGSADEDLVVVKKAKAPPATKDQIAMAVSMKASGSSYAAIEKETGLNPKQAATIVFKHKKAAANIAQVLTPKSGFKTKTQQPPPPVPVADPPPAPPTLTQFEQITAQGYEWKAKTSGPNKGKFAFFQNGVQVSKFADKADWASVVSTMHHGKGPGYKAPPPPPEPGKIGGLIADHEGMYDAPLSPWPIDDDVVRTKGSSSYLEVRTIGSKWTSSLPGDQREALYGYTGAGSGNINSKLRQGGVLSPVAKRIDAALNAAPLPPPRAVVPALPLAGVAPLPGFAQMSPSCRDGSTVCACGQ